MDQWLLLRFHSSDLNPLSIIQLRAWNCGRRILIGWLRLIDLLGTLNIRNHLYLQLDRVDLIFGCICDGRSTVSEQEAAQPDWGLVTATSSTKDKPSSQSWICKANDQPTCLRMPLVVCSYSVSPIDNGPSFINNRTERRIGSPLNHTDTGLVMVRSL